MKENFTRFECDTCHKEVTKTAGQGYPYEEGWEYLYNFDGQTPRENNPKQYGRFKEKDKHFCGKECEFKFIEKVVNEAAGPEKAEDVAPEVAEELAEEVEVIDIEEEPVKEPEPVTGDLSMEELEKQKLKRAKAAAEGKAKEPLTPPKPQKEEKPASEEDKVLEELGVEKVN